MTDGGLCLLKVEEETVQLYMRLDKIESTAEHLQQSKGRRKGKKNNYNLNMCTVLVSKKVVPTTACLDPDDEQETDEIILATPGNHFRLHVHCFFAHIVSFCTVCGIAGPLNRAGKQEWELAKDNVEEWVEFVKRHNENYELYCWSPSLM